MYAPGEVLKHGEVELKVVKSEDCSHCTFNSDIPDINDNYCTRLGIGGADRFYCGVVQNGIKFVELDKYALLRLKGEL